MTETPTIRRRDVFSWLGVAAAVAALAVVVLALVSRGDAIVHGHPAYAVLLGITAAVAVLAGALVLRGCRQPRRRRSRAGAIVAMGLTSAWISLLVWLQPYVAVEPALTAMRSDAAVTVTQTPTDIVLAPTGAARPTAVFFQPGALVDARAYAAVLRPLAEAGYTVVIPKQPLGIAFLALGAFDDARATHPQVSGWVLGGHSLGGTVAAIQAIDATPPSAARVEGLLFFASYPAGDLSRTDLAVLSIAGSEDGLATPAKIEASRSSLPSSAEFVVVEGGSHAQFGAYGLQAGDGTALIDAAEAREQISAWALDFVASR